jgi:hypothetical protein
VLRQKIRERIAFFGDHVVEINVAAIALDASKAGQYYRLGDEDCRVRDEHTAGIEAAGRDAARRLGLREPGSRASPRGRHPKGDK